MSGQRNVRTAPESADQSRREISALSNSNPTLTFNQRGIRETKVTRAHAALAVVIGSIEYRGNGWLDDFLDLQETANKMSLRYTSRSQLILVLDSCEHRIRQQRVASFVRVIIDAKREEPHGVGLEVEQRYSVHNPHTG